jgi:hypothetical protein
MLRKDLKGILRNNINNQNFPKEHWMFTWKSQCCFSLFPAAASPQLLLLLLLLR